MYGYIYKTTNNINGKIYIGKKKGLFTLNYLGSGRYLEVAVQKYGKENFSVELVEYCDTLEEQNTKEKYWISYYKGRKVKMYNISVGGDGGDTYHDLSAEDRQTRIEKLRRNGHFSNLTAEQIKAKNKKAWQTRREQGTDHYSDEVRRKMSEAHKGHIRKPESISKGINTRNGYKHSIETKRKISEGNKGKTVSTQSRKKMSEARKGKYLGENNHFFGKHHTEEAKRLISESSAGRVINTFWINNGVENRRIQQKELTTYETLGYQRGRIKWKV